MKPTIKDLAAEFGVDKATVSRALSGKPGVSDKLREKILLRARSLGFIPNAQARALATGNTETIALVFCDETSWFLENPFYSSVLAGIASEAISRDFALTFCSLSATAYTPGGPLPKVLAEGRADGFLFVGDQDDSLIKTVAGYGYPLLLVDHILRGEDLPSVIVENIDAACAAVEHLISLGHKRIGYVSGSLKSPSFNERLAGYRAALRAHKLDDEPDLVQVGEVGEAGYDCMLRLLALKRPPTAVFASNDINAIQAMKAAHEKGLDIPGDISVVGFDDSRAATDAWPALTTMRVDKQEMGRTAVHELIALIEGQKSRNRQHLVRAELVVRSSTAPPASNA
ncbi:MAG: LacI family DNA-binding transcriptional regulator [Kiritimatiellae bacterium]|nr:LacI family DNA-binding transcriptional regulator [Kiritimatiellia bacterium]